MKNNIFKHFFLAVGLFLGITSCEDREIVNIDNQASSVIIDLSKNDLILDSNFPSNPALTINWSSATYTVPVEVKYELQMSATETFETSEVLANTTQSQTVATFTTLEMNNAAKKVGLVPDVAQKMYFRVKSFVGDNILPQVSNVTSLLITPYVASPTYEYVDLFLIGDATAGGWDNLVSNNNLLPLLKTSDSNIYSFTGLFKVGGFKIIKEKGSWDAQYGLGASAGVLSTDGGSGDIKITQEGYYKLTINTSALSYTIEALPNPTTTYNSVSIIGSVNGNWDTDTQLTKSTFDPHLWTATNVELKAGEFKFRANNDWAVSWGTNAAFFGTASIGGANIPLSDEWTYNVYFNDSTGNYTLIPVK